MLSEQPVLGTHGMVATAHYLATHAGLSILTQGGNAIDAAIAANAAMTVVYPSTCSAGGDIFMLIWEAKTQQLYALNGSGRAPTAMTPEYFASRNIHELPQRGPLSINVPGAVDGWFEAQMRFGSLSMESILAPAIALAEEGMPVSPKLNQWLKLAKDSISPWESSAEIFLPAGQPVRAGTRLRQANLARTYQMLAREGREAFYSGPLARSITEYVQACGGVLSLEDMQKHHSDWVNPISTSYRGYDIYGFPPNSQGLTALEMLNIIEGYNLKSYGYQSPEYLHILLEAKKLAFADRDRYISDPTFADIPIERLLSKDYAAEQRQRINLTKATPHVLPGLEKDGDTMYLCTADNQGNVVSLIQSLYSSFGSGIVGGDTGVLLHNRGSYFSLDPRHVNYLQPGKRTMHTLMPAMVMQQGQPYIALGSMGGDAQPQIHVQLLTAMLDFGMNAQQAISAPRWRSGRFLTIPYGKAVELGKQADIDEKREKNIAESVVLEQRFPREIPLSLEMLGHRIFIHGPWEDDMGHAQAIVINPETHIFEGAADPRCDGLALGW
ncbi:gamma-glutamyltransferase [Ktedonosporobacter rubrisoli]|uniref:Glutathione hydrolase proenzyme n=1 Tax=Ktedonosporobacter rubrisoli TaxID=2509675 RepID=A0A4P6JRE5_KTERU|nr:gamma-glutamyltransferase [Ktedonosporobacter rubrisoli]QBD78028.1 gamma-glutamyltransferase [Ktedonosporobacter rubrisoli]